MTYMSVFTSIRFDILQRHVPWEEDPCVLADFRNEGVDLRAALGFCINGCEMRLGVHLAHQFKRFAAIDQIVDDQDAGAVAHHVRVG